MKLSTKGRYGLRLMIELATQHGKGPIMAENIATRQDISENYIHILVKQLIKAGLIKATRGRNGGYSLSRDPEKITALEIIHAMEGKISVVECTSQEGFCERIESCSSREVWQDLNLAIENALQGVTIARLARRQTILETPQYENS